MVGCDSSHHFSIVGCDSSHHFNYIDSFSYSMGNSFKIRRSAIFLTLAKPITFVNSLFDPTMKTRMFPMMRAFDISVFYRIIMNIIHMSCKILLIANQMFPDTGTSWPPRVSHNFVNFLFIIDHLTEKLSSVSVIFHIQWRWSGKSTILNISKGWEDWTWDRAWWRDERPLASQNILRRLYVTTVKKYVPPTENHRL